MAAMPNVDAVTPAFVQGETETKPSPAPAARSMSEIDALTTAPPRMAPQETAEDARVVVASETPRTVVSVMSD